MAERWTIKQLQSMGDLEFARHILHERANKLNPYSPLAEKLRSAASTIAEIEAEQRARREEAEKEKRHGPFDSAEEAFEALDWGYTYSESGEIELEKHSPAGEDFIFSIDGQNIPQEVREYAEGFDVDEHVALWVDERGKRGVPETARELVEDAEAIKAMLEELADALDEVKTNCDQGDYDCSTCIIRNACIRRDETK